MHAGPALLSPPSRLSSLNGGKHALNYRLRVLVLANRSIKASDLLRGLNYRPSHERIKATHGNTNFYRDSSSAAGGRHALIPEMGSIQTSITSRLKPLVASSPTKCT
jgi:hypothetical protein